MSRVTHASVWLSLVGLGLVAIAVSFATTGTVSLVFLLVAGACGLGVSIVTFVYWLESGRNPYRGFPYLLFDEADNESD